MSGLEICEWWLHIWWKPFMSLESSTLIKIKILLYTCFSASFKMLKMYVCVLSQNSGVWGRRVTESQTRGRRETLSQRKENANKLYACWFQDTDGWPREVNHFFYLLQRAYMYYVACEIVVKIKWHHSCGYLEQSLTSSECLIRGTIVMWSFLLSLEICCLTPSIKIHLLGLERGQAQWLSTLTALAADPSLGLSTNVVAHNRVPGDRCSLLPHT